MTKAIQGFIKGKKPLQINGWVALGAMRLVM
jgi:hypothetical protein